MHIAPQRNSQQLRARNRGSDAEGAHCSGPGGAGGPWPAYFPMQKREKMESSTSSVTSSPLTSPSASVAARRSIVQKSKGRSSACRRVLTAGHSGPGTGRRQQWQQEEAASRRGSGGLPRHAGSKGRRRTFGASSPRRPSLPPAAVGSSHSGVAQQAPQRYFAWVEARSACVLPTQPLPGFCGAALAPPAHLRCWPAPAAAPPAHG